MKEYIATFHTHLSAMITGKKLKENNIEFFLEPVPRKLSSSCGTCIRFTSHNCMEELMDRDCEAVYEVVHKQGSEFDYIMVLNIS